MDTPRIDRMRSADDPVVSRLCVSEIEDPRVVKLRVFELKPCQGFQALSPVEIRVGKYTTAALSASAQRIEVRQLIGINRGDGQSLPQQAETRKNPPRFPYLRQGRNPDDREGCEWQQVSHTIISRRPCRSDCLERGDRQWKDPVSLLARIRSRSQCSDCQEEPE